MEQPNTQLTEDQKVEQYIREIAQQEANKLKADKVVEPKLPEQLVLTIAGKEMTFKDAQEASSVLTSVYEQQAKPQQTGKQVTDDTGGPKWSPEDQKRYVDLFMENPLHAADFLDERRFGIKNPTEFMRQNLATTAALATNHAIDNFVSRTPDYYVCPENANAMQTVLSELGGGKPVINPMALEAAFAIADKRGLLKKEEKQQTQQTTTYNPYLAGPPNSGRNTSNSNTNISPYDAENLTTDQIEAIFAKMQQ